MRRHITTALVAGLGVGFVLIPTTALAFVQGHGGSLVNSHTHVASTGWDPSPSASPSTPPTVTISSVTPGSGHIATTVGTASGSTTVTVTYYLGAGCTGTVKATGTPTPSGGNWSHITGNLGNGTVVYVQAKQTVSGLTGISFCVGPKTL